MLALLPNLAAFLALIAVAAVAFARPDGVLWRAGLAGAFGAVCAGVVWSMAVQAGNSDALWRWLAAFIVAILAAVMAGFATLVRGVLNEMGARLLR